MFGVGPSSSNHNREFDGYSYLVTFLLVGQVVSFLLQSFLNFWWFDLRISEKSTILLVKSAIILKLTQYGPIELQYYMKFSRKFSEVTKNLQL